MGVRKTASRIFLLLFTFNLLTAAGQLTSLAMRPQGVSEEYLLLRYLLTNYSKVARPVARSNEAVLVLARLFPIKLLNMYEKNEVLEMTMRLQLTWRDRMLVWHPPDFNNQSTVVIPGGQLWIPDLQIVNSVSDLYALLRDQKFDFKVHSDGSVWWHPTGNLVTRCELHLMYFPFDYQRCPIMLESAIYSHTQLNLTVRTDRAPVSLSMYAESGHWDLLKVTGQPRVLWVTNSTAFTRVEFWLYLGRKTTYFKMNIIFPCCMLSGLQMLTFFFPLESTERVPEATSILLSVIVFQTMIVDQLPRSSNSIPLLCIYVDMLTGISVLAVAEAVIVASLVSRKGQKTKAPKWAHNFLRFIYQWNSETAQTSRHSRSRASLAFFRNSTAFQTFFGRENTSSSFRRKKASHASRHHKEAIILDNINTANIGANASTNFHLSEPPHYDTRKSSNNSNRSNLHFVQSAPPGLPPNGMITTSVKFLPCGGGSALELIGEDSSNENNNTYSNDLGINQINKSPNPIAKRNVRPQLSQQPSSLPFDAPLADFDPDSSIMLNSSMFGSAYQSMGGPQSVNLPPSLVNSVVPIAGAGMSASQLLEMPLNAELYVDDVNSVTEDVWQQSTGLTKQSPPQPSPTAHHPPSQGNRSKQSAELSPLLAPRKLNRKVSMEPTPQESLSPASQRAAIAAVAAATPSNEPRRTASYASTGGKARESGDFSLMLPGLPRQPCMRRSRPSLFIPAADSDDIILDWIYLARVLDAVMFLICLTVVIVVPVVLFGILPPTTVD